MWDTKYTSNYNKVLEEQPLVSCVVNCYNGEAYLRICLDSIIAQTYKNLEIIFWDNASTDNSKEIFKSYNDSRFKYYKSKKNVTLGQARAWAVEKCQGEYIAFLDVDDIWLPNKISIQIARMIKDKSVLSYSSSLAQIEGSKKLKIEKVKYKTGKSNFSKNLKRFEIGISAVVLKRSELINRNLNFDPSIVASEEFSLFMPLIYGNNVSVITQPLIIYTYRTNSLTNNSIEYWSRERFHALDKLKTIFPNLVKEYPKEYNLAQAAGVYYRVRYEISKGNRINALLELKKIKDIDYKFKIIYFLLKYFPSLLKLIFKVRYKH